MGAPMELYAAYGSNLDEADLRAWCAERGKRYPLGAWRGGGFIADHAPAFGLFAERRGGGVLDVVERPGQVAPCGLFEVDEGGFDALNAKEGAGWLYERVRVTVLEPSGGAVQAIAYRAMPSQRRTVAAARDYAEVVRRGAAARGLPTAWIDAAMAQAIDPHPVAAFFVYGTLLRGESRAGVVRGLEPASVEPGSVRGRLLDLDRYPGMVPPAGPNDVSRVQGELVVLAPGSMPSAVAQLDEIEGFEGFDRAESVHLFVRRLIEVEVADGRQVLAWTYLFARSAGGAMPIEHGSWRRSRGRPEPFDK
ncbi:MAG: gamma-glutamylcyclotransferase [Phycisphaerales bacterium]|nr:gamma-glutamylcyclotransferase [Phycisphaerales bacterium]